MGNGQFISEPPGEAIQIVKIVEPEGSVRKHFHLDEVALAHVLSRIGDMPVAVLTVAGRSHCGKSFTANYMLRYLANNSIAGKVNGDWMGPNQKDVELKGFPWRNEDAYTTHGLYMWSEPFVMEDKDGNKLAVLVMDTQGIFDDETAEEDWVTIMGLAAMMSSCLIYNVRGDLGDDDLTFMNKFVAFASHAYLGGVETTDRPKLLQTLAILVHSYQPTTNKFNYSCQQGNELIERRLEITPRMSQEGHECRTRLRNWTENIRGYVLLAPNKAMLDDTYNGNWSEMDTLFADTLKTIVNDLFRQDHLEAKKFADIEVQKDDLLELFRAFVKIFNGDYPTDPSFVANAVIYSNFQRLTIELEAQYQKLLSSTTGSEAAVHWSRVRIVKTASFTAGLGASIAAAGLAFAPLTGGVSLAANILAGILSGGSLTTAIGAGIGNYVKSKEFEKEIAELLAKWKTANEEFVTCACEILDDSRFATKVRNLPTGFRPCDLGLVSHTDEFVIISEESDDDTANDTWGKMEETAASSTVVDAKQVGTQSATSILVAAAKVATDFVDDIAIPFGKTAAQVAPKAFAVAGLAFVSIDFGFLIYDWLSEHPSENVIKQKIEELEQFETNVRNIDLLMQHLLLNKTLPDSPY